MNTIKIGWASRDVSTDKPVNIPGQFHMRISKGVMDKVTVNSLVLDSGDDIVIFLSIDALFIHGNLISNIRKKTALLNSHIPVNKIIVNATHTHTSPAHFSGNIWSDGTSSDEENLYKFMSEKGIEIASSEEYRDFLSGEASDAICEAYEKRAEGGIAYGYGYAVTSHNRRCVYFDDVSKRPGANVSHGGYLNGYASMYGNTHDANFSHYETGADHFVNLLYTFDCDKNLTGAIINVACPAQNSEGESEISADYWNEVRNIIRKEYGDISILPQCAPAGDLSPRILHYTKAQERRFKLKYGENYKTEMCERHDIAQHISSAFTETLEWAKKEIKNSLPISHIVDTIEVSKRIITDDEYKYAKDELEDMKDIVYKKGDNLQSYIQKSSSLTSCRIRAKQIMKRYELQKTEKKLPMEIHVLKLGDIAFCTNALELYMDYGHRVQARSPFEQTFVIQLVGQEYNNEYVGYLPTERAFEGKGYSACMYCNKISPEGGQEWVDETVKRLKKICIAE